MTRWLSHYTTTLKFTSLMPNILLCHHRSHESSLTLKSLSILGQESPHNHWIPGWLIQTRNLNSLLLRNVTKTIFYSTVPMEKTASYQQKAYSKYFCLFQGFTTCLKNNPNAILYTAITQVLTSNRVLKPMPIIYRFNLLLPSWLLVF